MTTSVEIENHVEVSERLLEQARQLFEAGDLRQASEKAWGAVERYLEGEAKSRGWAKSWRGGLDDVAGDLAFETDDWRLAVTLHGSAGYLRRSIQGDRVSDEMVGGAIQDATELISMLKNRIGPPVDPRPSQIRRPILSQPKVRAGSVRRSVKTGGTHAEISERMLEQASLQYVMGDLPQASESAWGAVAHYLKGEAKSRGWEHHDHSSLSEIVDDMSFETDDPQKICRLYRSVGMLHVNFYENWLTRRSVSGGIEDAEDLISRLKARTGRPLDPRPSQLGRHARGLDR